LILLGASKNFISAKKEVFRGTIYVISHRQKKRRNKNAGNHREIVQSKGTDDRKNDRGDQTAPERRGLPRHAQRPGGRETAGRVLFRQSTQKFKQDDKSFDKTVSRLKTMIYGMFGKKNAVVRDFGLLPFKEKSKTKKTQEKRLSPASEAPSGSFPFPSASYPRHPWFFIPPDPRLEDLSEKAGASHSRRQTNRFQTTRVPLKLMRYPTGILDNRR
jgi:hypothetical protein